MVCHVILESGFPIRPVLCMFSNKLLSPRTVSADACLLIFRITTMSLLFAKHGLEKIIGFQEMLSGFPDPIGIGKTPSFLFAFFTDTICTILILVGLFSRFASFLILINLLVALFAFHHGIINDHGEAMILYIITVLFLLNIGPGKYSLDAIINNFKPSK